MRALAFAIRTLVPVLLLAGMVLSASAQTTVDQRLTSMVQANVTDPWPGIDSPNNAAGIFSYALASLHLDQNVSQANDLLSTFYANNPIPDSDTDRSVRGVVFDITDEGDRLHVIADLPVAGFEIFARLMAEADALAPRRPSRF